MAGAWSDRHGRKAIIALPIFGQFLLNITFIINYTFLEELPFEVHATSVANKLNT